FPAGAQRYTEMRIELKAPVTADTLFTDVQFNISASIKNIGADTFRLQDSLAFELAFDGSPISFDFGNGFVPYMTLTNRELLPGDSASVNFNFTLNSGWPTGPAEVCVAIFNLNT